MTTFSDQLQQGSFRGVPFGVLTGELRVGRRVAVHEYPFRDTPWVEDLGRATRKISFVAFLITDSQVYGGGEVIAQREALIAACETKGPGTLIHPTLGRLTVSVPDDGLTVTERWDEGRYFEVGFTFIESGERVFPSAATATADNSATAATQTDLAAAADFVLKAKISIARGSAIIKQAVSTATGWIDNVNRLAEDATGLFTMIATLPGNFGRFFAGGTLGYDGQSVPAGSPTTVAGLIAQGCASRAAVTAANTALLDAAGGSDPQATADTTQATAAALLAATVDPAVAIRLLTALADFYPAEPTTASVIGMAMASMQTALGALARRAALAALVRASALYQPTSRDDAAALRDALAGILDAEILIAGDSGDDGSYVALRALRVAMVVDLNSRGAGLPPMKVFELPANMTALAIAQRLYQNAERGDQLIIEADPPHPAFMPVRFSALAE